MFFGGQTMSEIIAVDSIEEFKVLYTLFIEYEKDLGFELSFQDFASELQQLDDMYSLPEGRAFLMKADDVFIGCVAVRKLDQKTGEVKRMFVKPAHRGRGYGLKLLQKSVEAARELGYEKLRLDTLDTMNAAIALYQNNGFYEIEPYCYNPFDNALFLKNSLELFCCR